MCLIFRHMNDESLSKHIRIFCWSFLCRSIRQINSRESFYCTVASGSQATNSKFCLISRVSKLCSNKLEGCKIQKHVEKIATEALCFAIRFMCCLNLSFISMCHFLECTFMYKLPMHAPFSAALTFFHQQN